MKTLLLLCLIVLFFIAPAHTEDTVNATRIRNKDAPVIDGKLDTIWKEAGKLRFPDDGGNYVRFGKSTVQQLEQDVESTDAVYRRQRPFTIAEQRYAETDPSTYTVSFLHDDLNLYVAVHTSDDRFIEGSEYDQTSDGFGLALKTKSGTIQKYWLTWFRGKINEETDPTPSGPPLDRERMCYDAEWRSSMDGTWNEGKDQDKGYLFEFYIPLETLGGYQPGDRIAANLIAVDHDKNPGGTYNDPKTQFMKTSWGAIDDVADLNVPRVIQLSPADPVEVRSAGHADRQDTLVARAISPGDAPRIDGILDDEAWKSASLLYFPNPLGRTWTMSKARYNQIDPSVYSIGLLHDGTYLYVGVESTDRWIESAPLNQTDVDQESDGLTSLVIELPERGQTDGQKELRISTFWYKLDAWGSQLDQVLKDSGRKPHGDHFRDVDQDGKKEELHFMGGIPRTAYVLDNDQVPIQWAYSPIGPDEWNNPAGVSKGYSFEYRIPLKALGNLGPGETTRANIVLTDHDANPGRRYSEFDTRYQSFWWGTDQKDLWQYDATGKPLKRIEIPKDKERFIRLDSGIAPAPKHSTGPRTRPINSFETPSSFVLTHNGSKKAGSITRGFSGHAAALQSSDGKPASFDLVSEGTFDLEAMAVLQFVVKSPQEKTPFQVSLKDAKGRTAVVAEGALSTADLKQSDYSWHKVVLPIEELKRRASNLDFKSLREITLAFPATTDAAVDELSALSYGDILASSIDFLAGQQIPATGLLRSFSGTNPAHTYDQAVALLAFTDAGRKKEARLLADAMIGLQENSGDEGFFYDSYSAVDRHVGQGTDAGVGPNTWMAYALAVYGDQYNDNRAKAAADRVARWLTAKRDVFQKQPGKAKGKLRTFWEKLKFWDEPERDGDWEKISGSLFNPDTGGVWAAIQHDPEEGAPTRPDIQGHSHDRMLFWYSTEGVIDAQQLFELMTSLGFDYRKQAEKVRDWMFRGGENSGWNEAGFFNLGHNDFTGADTRIYLDTHTWGAILAKLHGQNDKAEKALAKAGEMLSTRPFQGNSIRGFNDSRYPENESIWYGGTAHYVAACNYLGEKEKAAEFVSTLLRAQGLSGGWPHSSDDAYLTCFVRKSDAKVALGYVDASTGMAYDDPAHLGKPGHEFKASDYPEPEWVGYGTYHNRRDAVGETAWIYFALKGYSTEKLLPYLPVKK